MLSARDSDGRYPLSGKEYSALLSLFAVNSTLNDQANVLTERIKTKSGAWRDFRLATVKMQKVLDEIVTTIPVKKLHAIARDLQHARVHVDINTASERRYNGVIYVDESALIALLDYAVSQNCWCCEKKKQGRQALSDLEAHYRRDAIRPRSVPQSCRRQLSDCRLHNDH